MISYEPFWNTLKERNISTYQLINKQGILPGYHSAAAKRQTDYHYNDKYALHGDWMHGGSNYGVCAGRK